MSGGLVINLTSARVPCLPPRLSLSASAAALSLSVGVLACSMSRPGSHQRSPSAVVASLGAILRRAQKPLPFGNHCAHVVHLFHLDQFDHFSEQGKLSLYTLSLPSNPTFLFIQHRSGAARPSVSRSRALLRRRSHPRVQVFPRFKYA